MKKQTLTKKIAACLTAAAFVVGAEGLVLAPRAEAISLGNVIGAAIGGAATSAQLNKQIKYYNNTEEGRQEFFEEMQKQYGVYEDDYYNGRIDTIMGNLTSAIGSVDESIYEKPYNYFINQDTSFNAFCSLGHNMSINIGLFSTINNDDEIAVVLGHEMGHGQKDHPAKGAKRSIGPAVLASATGSVLGSIVANIWNNQGITKPMEWEADNLAFEYMTHTYYNPGACAAIWQRVIDKGGDSSGSSLAMIMVGGSDHPSNSDRRDNYVKKLNEYSGKHVTAKDGTVKVNDKDFVTPAASSDMSGAERSYFVLGNLAAAYHNGHANESAYVSGSTVYLGAQAIMTCQDDDESASVLAERLNSIK